MAKTVTSQVVLPSDVAPRHIQWAQLVVFSRNIDANSLSALRFAHGLGIPTIYELDDSYFDAPLDVPALERYRNPAALGRHLEFIRSASRVHCYSQTVMAGVAEAGGNPFRAVTYFDDALRCARKDIRPRLVGNSKRIVFPSGRSDTRASERFLSTLFRAIVECIPDAELHLWRDPGPLRGHPRVFWNAGAPYEPFIARLSSLSPAVGLAYLGSSPWELSKTNNKFREFGGLGIPGVYSDTPVYSECVEDSVSGYLAGEDTDAWLEMISELLVDSEKRVGIAESAYDVVSRDFILARAVGFWERALADCLDQTVGGNRAGLDTPRMALTGSRASVFRMTVEILRAVPSAQRERSGKVEIEAGPLSGGAPTVRIRPDGRVHNSLTKTATTIIAPCRSEGSAGSGRWLPPMASTSAGKRIIHYRPQEPDGPNSLGFAVVMAVMDELDLQGLKLDWSARPKVAQTDILMRGARLILTSRRRYGLLRKSVNLLRSPLPVILSSARNRLRSHSLPLSGQTHLSTEANLADETT